MTPADRAAAQAALNDGRAVYGRLDQIRGPEDAAADIIELWAASESAMRAMLGGSTLAGQALVREVRQRGDLSLEQANSIASFWDAKSRAEDVAYKPTLTDVGFARSGYNDLGRAVGETSNNPSQAPGTAAGKAAGTAAGAAAGSPTSTFAPGGTPSGAAATRPTVAPADTSDSDIADVPVPARRALRPILIGLIVLVIVIAGAIGAYFTVGSRKYDSALTNAINLMTTGRTEAARGAFGAMTREYPDRAAPHVFLSRLARTSTPPDMNTARQELITAIRIEPAYEPAQREMGVFQLADHNPSLARNFLIRAVQLAPADSAAQGYLGCALMGLNRVDEAQKFIARAGTGTWSACTPQTSAPPKSTP